MLGCIVVMLGCIVLPGARVFQGVSDPDSGVAGLLGYLGGVCGAQKYSNTMPEPAQGEHFLLLTGTSRYRAKTFPNQPIWSSFGFSGRNLYHFSTISI